MTRYVRIGISPRETPLAGTSRMLVATRIRRVLINVIVFTSVVYRFELKGISCRWGGSREDGPGKAQSLILRQRTYCF